MRRTVSPMENSLEDSLYLFQLPIVIVHPVVNTLEIYTILFVILVLSNTTLLIIVLSEIN